MTGTSNNTLTPTPTINPENHSQASSVDSSDTNAIHTPPSIAADQSIAPALDISTQPQSTTDGSNTMESLGVPQDASVLPNWGASQLFSGPSRAVNSENTSALPRERQEVSADEGPSSSFASVSEEEQRRREKGKAKAATVEDTADEMDGS
jgi:E3 ubiquitin-protein ligase synoviolin